MEEKQIKDGITYQYNLSEKTLDIYPAESGASIALPDYLEEEERPWEKYAGKIERIVIKEGITKIGDLAFAECKGLKSVAIKGCDASIGKLAFYQCKDLRSVMIEGSIISIGEKAFCGCENLRSVTVLGNTASIGDRAFSGCRRLYRLMRPDSVMNIGREVLDHCRYISGVTDAHNVGIGNMNESTERIWNYYKKAAEVFGLQKVKDNNKKKTMEETQTVEDTWVVEEAQTAGELQTAKKKEPDEKQAEHSLWWFYLDPEEKKHFSDLMKAFLGDEEAKGRLQWDEELPNWDVAKEYLSSLSKGELNESQRKAIEVALKNPISFIQGPPGTGKTTTIRHLASCMARMGKKVAIVSSNSSALDAIHEKEPEFINEKNEKCKLARLGNKDTREIFNDDYKKEHKDEKNPLEFQVIISAEQFWGASGHIVKRWREPQLNSADFLKQYPVFTSTIHSLKSLFQDSGTLQYDYVIVDEVSQVDVVKGLIAMSCAKHLVLVGDEEQLPPVLKSEKIERAEEELKKESREKIGVGSVYKMNEDTSFLDMCLKIFKVMKNAGEIELQKGDVKKRVKVKEFLNEHYRCHPGIIRFCQKEIYGERLEISTGEYDKNVKIPIKILWYEGDYCERRFYTGNKKKETEEEASKTKCNVKQFEIFMHEEWPKLLKRMEGKKVSSFSILSPFKEQIQLLSKQIEAAYKKYQKEEGENAVKLNISTSLENEGSKKKRNKEQDGASTDERAYKSYELSVSTIHKSQGREFDIVYFLPAEDKSWEWPWSQKRRLVNVAVSRAKKELCVIVSTLLMSEKVQRYLLKPEDVEVLEEKSNADDKKHTVNDKKSEDDLFVQKLVDYVYEAGEMNEEIRQTDGKDFLFHQTKCLSIFDMGKKKREREREKYSCRAELSDPEVIVAAALKKMQAFQENNLVLYHNVQIGDIQLASGQRMEDYLNALNAEDMPEDDNWKALQNDNVLKDYKQYVRSHAEFDIVVCRKGGEVLMAIEVDGLYHRFCETKKELNHQKKRDEQKNWLAEHILGAACYTEGNRFAYDENRKIELGEKKGSFAFLRLPCDGSTCFESRVLWDNGDKELRNEFFTMDELLEKEVEKSVESSCKFQPEKSSRYTISPVGKLAYLQYHNFETFITRGSMSDVKRHSLEEVRKFSYEKNAAPDYSDKHVQERYLLSYFSAYACEYLHVYRKMYKVFQGRDFCKKQIEVTSLGCGNMVDYWGLAKAAMENYGKREAFVYYIGVDAADWKTTKNLVPKREVDKVQFVQDRAESYLEGQKELASDVYVFPKSLSEYNRKRADFKRICKALSTKQFTKDEVCILTVFRSNESDVRGQKRDNENYCDELKKAVEKNGFYASYDKIWGIKAGKLEEKGCIEKVDNPQKIWEIDRHFEYGDGLYGKTLKILNKAEEEMEKAGLSKKEVRNPLINTYWCCRMMVFKRR